MVQIPLAMAEVLSPIIVGVASAVVTAFIGAWFVAAADVRRHDADIRALDRRLAEWVVIADRNLQREFKAISTRMAASGQQYDGAMTNALVAARTGTIYGYRQQTLDTEVARAGYMSLGYVAEKLIGGVEALAASERPLRARLFDAWISGVGRLEPGDFPDPEHAARFTALADAASHVDGDRGAFSATPEKDLKGHAEQLCRLLWAIVPAA